MPRIKGPVAIASIVGRFSSFRQRESKMLNTIETLPSENRRVLELFLSTAVSAVYGVRAAQNGDVLVLTRARQSAQNATKALRTHIDEHGCKKLVQSRRGEAGNTRPVGGGRRVTSEEKLPRMGVSDHGAIPAFPRCIVCGRNLKKEPVNKGANPVWWCPKCGVERKPQFFA